jgi:hypothetical protein
MPIYLNYSGDAGASRSFPIAGVVAAGIDATAHAALLGGFYTLEPKVLGARYSAGVFVPYVWERVTASITTAFEGRSRTDSVNGFGDVSLIPVMLAWETGSWQYGTFLPVYAPTGAFEVGRLANPGLNYWTFNPTVYAAYNNEQYGFNAALLAGITVNTENGDTGYRSGSLFHLEASVQQLLPLGPGFAGIGANAFFLDQVTGDSGSGATRGDFKGRTVGIGPVATYILPLKATSLVAEFRWLPELDTRNRLEGNYFWLKVAAQF